MKKVFAILMISMWLGGCDRLNSQQKQIDDLQKKVESLQKNVDLAFTNSLDYKIEKFRQSTLFFTPANVGGGFQIISDQEYSFIISLDKLKKFPGGCEAYFDIGN